MPDIHETAIVPAGIRVHDVSIGPYAVVEDGAEIGDGCVIGPHVVIRGSVSVGNAVTIHHGASIGGPPQVKPPVRHPGRVSIGNGTVIREYVTVNASSEPDGITRVGDCCTLMAYAHIGHDAVVEHDAILVNGATLGGFSHICHHATVSAMVPVHQYCRVGAYAYVGGGFRVVQDVPPFVLAGGEPLAPHGLNVIGLRRNGFTGEQMRRLKAIYRLFYRSGLNITQALDHIDTLEPSQERDEFAGFIRGSARGVIR